MPLIGSSSPKMRPLTSLLTCSVAMSPSLLSSSPVREVPAGREASHLMWNGEEEVRGAAVKNIFGLFLSGQEELMGVANKQT